MKARSRYYQHIHDILNNIVDSQEAAIQKAALEMTQCIEKGHTIYAFGASHAGILTQELFYRAGGLALINPIMAKEVQLDVRPITLTSQMERLPGYGTLILEHTPIQKEDVLIIHSVSGRNTIAIDMALRAKAMGVIVIAVTNIEYSQAVVSRHETGKKLLDIADSSITIDGLDQKIAPTSTIAGAFILNSVIIQVVENLVNDGFEPPIFHSANIDGGDEYNQNILNQYKNRIHYMK